MSLTLPHTVRNRVVGLLSASVLGGFIYSGMIGKSADYNNYTSNGQYLFDTWDVTGSNYPFINGYGVAFVYNNEKLIYQICFDFDDGRIALRRYARSASNWSAWKIIGGA